jgi:hypothetical protein
MPRKRPHGITVLAVAYFVAAATLALAAVPMLLLGGHGSLNLRSDSPGPRFSVTLREPHIVALCGGLAAIAAALGAGLWMLRDWARIASAIALTLALAAAILLNVPPPKSARPIAWSAAFCAALAFALWYLLRPHTARAFHARGPGK